MSTRCISPYNLKPTKERPESIAVPCGKCIPCKKRRVSGWSFRLMKEDSIALSSYFVTFTYNTDHVPITNRGYMSLYKPHFQNYIKRLRYRNRISDVPIRYFAAGEYGEQSWRPHYHAIMFNVHLEHLIGPELAFQEEQGYIQLTGADQFTCPDWNLGYITVGRVSEASVGYTLKYIMKNSRVPVHRNDDRVPEFQLMSKGLGKSYLTDEAIDWHYADFYNRYYTPLKDGKKIALPRYYKDKIYSEHDREAIGQYVMSKMDDTDDLSVAQIEHKIHDSRSKRFSEKI